MDSSLCKGETLSYKIMHQFIDEEATNEFFFIGVVLSLILTFFFPSFSPFKLEWPRSKEEKNKLAASLFDAATVACSFCK